ncbi:hypothetical protein [Flammeovirga sp. OC4]|uniref:hypothetical protein n=1 Tax=Flammeovirga sp. OC4 TaxID=1382345 RepID=UPI0005C741B6|nr:hypothetical protein [Flammeovirga sp. OC4]
MKNKRLKIIYAFSLSPLIFGSITFFYWYYSRVWFAKNIDIELTAFFTIMAYFLFGIIALIQCSIYVSERKSSWKNIRTPLIILLITIPITELYSSIHISFEQKAFINILNDINDSEIVRIYSDNFEKTNYKDKKDFIFSYYPVYKYDWTQGISDDLYNYKINKLRIEIKLENDSIQTFEFPSFSKGQCGTVRVSEIIRKE